MNKICSEANENYFAHGMKVVEFYKENKQGLVNLERKWREHFLSTMKPKYMPDLWSVEHNVERLVSFERHSLQLIVKIKKLKTIFRLQIRANEGRIDENDLRLAGLTMAN